MQARPIRQQYEDFMRHVFEHGVNKADRTGTGTAVSLATRCASTWHAGFPMVTTKKLHLRKSIIHELLWFLRGETNVAYLR